VKTIMGGAVFVLGLLLASCAGEENTQAEKGMEGDKKPATATIDADDPNTVKIAVPTMQCESCVETITEGVKGVSAAQEVNVDLASKTVFVKVANNTPEARMEIEKAIAGVGYSTASTPRDTAAYAKLPDCCKDGGMDDLKKN